MAERKKTPDILADLLGTSPSGGSPTPNAASSAGLPVKHQDAQPESQKDSKALKQLDSKKENPRDIRPNYRGVGNKTGKEEVAPLAPSGEVSLSEVLPPGVESKIKVTFYLSEETVDLFEEAQRTLRRLGRSQGKNPASKSATSKSALLEEALKLVCSDIQSHGLESQLARKMF